MARKRRDAHCSFQQGRGIGAGTREFLQDLVAIGFERIDPQVDRRAVAEGCRFLDPFVAEDCLEMRNAPFRNIGANMIRRGIEIAVSPDRQAFGFQRFWREFIAFESDIDILNVEFRIGKQNTKGDMTRRIAIHAPGKRQFPPEGIIDDIADDRAIARTGKAMR